MAWLTDEKTLHAANLLVCAGTLATPVGILTAGGAIVAASLSVKEIAKRLTADTRPLAETLRKHIDAEIAKLTHMSGDAAILVPQMIEAALPTSQAFIDAGQKVEPLLFDMLQTLAALPQPEYDLHVNTSAFEKVMRSVLTYLLHDPAFTAQLAPLREQVLLEIPQILKSIKDAQKETDAKIERMLVQNNDLLGLVKTLAENNETNPDNILTLDELRHLAEMFEGENLKDKASILSHLEYQAQQISEMQSTISDLQGKSPSLDNILSSIASALSRGRISEARRLLRNARSLQNQEHLLKLLKEDAQIAELEARAALLENDLTTAFDLLSRAADSFASAEPLEPIQRRLQYEDLFFAHGLRYGGTGMALSEEMIRDALAKCDRNKAPELWGAGQNSLAIALQNQGVRTDGAKGADLLADAVTAYRDVLKVYTRADHPVQWAATQNNLGSALQDQGIRTDGAKGADLLAQAVSAYRDALKVRIRDDHPVGWAMTQNNLGTALQEQGIRTDGAKGADLLAQAVTAYRDALKVRTRDDHPVDWAMTQNNLAIALQEQGIRTDGAKGTELLAQAVTAYRDALKVRTSDDHPVQWAMTQNNLAIALRNQGARTDGAKGADLLAQAVTAYRGALKVRTRDDHPVQWAMTQENIAIALRTKAAHDSCTDPASILTDALAAVDAALTVYDPEHMSYDHGTATRLRTKILAQIDALS